MDIKRIIVSRTDKIGDLILSIPSFFMIKKMYPESELTVLVNKYNYDIVKNLPFIDRILKIDEFKKSELLEKIAYFKAEVFIALYHDKYIANLVLNSKAKKKIGPISKFSSFFTYNKGVIQKRSKSIKNEMDYNLDLVRKLNPKLYDKLFELNFSLIIEDDNRYIADFYFKENKLVGKTLAINPFSGGSGKNITDEQYASLIKEFKKRNPDINIILLCRENEEERASNLIEKSKEKVHLFANSGGILNIAAIIEKSDAYLGASTGPTHIAGFLNKKIVAIYSNRRSQSPTRWGVKGSEEVIYVIPDKNNSQEDYKRTTFDKYSLDTEKEIIEALEKVLEIGE